MRTDYGAPPNPMDDFTQAALTELAAVVEELPSIRTLELLRLRTPPSVEDRPGASPSHRSYADEARLVRDAGDSFTEAFLAAAHRCGDLESALAVVDYHQRFEDAAEKIVLHRSEFRPSKIMALAKDTRDNQILVLTSRVETEAGFWHLPLLDFKIASGASNERAAAFVAERLGGGVLVDSGSSYHLYGTQLLTERQMVDWLLHAQLFSRCVDTRWVTHQLLERRAALRLSRGGSRGSSIRFVARVSAPD